MVRPNFIPPEALPFFEGSCRLEQLFSFTSWTYVTFPGTLCCHVPSFFSYFGSPSASAFFHVFKIWTRRCFFSFPSPICFFLLFFPKGSSPSHHIVRIGLQVPMNSPKNRCFRAAGALISAGFKLSHGQGSFSPNVLLATSPSFLMEKNQGDRGPPQGSVGTSIPETSPQGLGAGRLSLSLNPSSTTPV